MTKQDILQFAKEAGADKCGFAPVKIYEELYPRLEKRGFVPFTRTNLEARVNPYLHLKEVKSIIVCLFKYQNGGDKTVAKYARGGDYHPYIKEKLRAICDKMGDNKYRLLVDTGGLCDRYLAYMAGLGFYGNNNLLYSEGLGSRFYIGSILTDVYFPPDSPTDQKCLDCGRCINACPGGALGKDFSFDVTKCVSYLTQKKEPLSDREQQLVNKGQYSLGCDICADICPLNEGKL